MSTAAPDEEASKYHKKLWLTFIFFLVAGFAATGVFWYANKYSFDLATASGPASGTAAPQKSKTMIYVAGAVILIVFSIVVFLAVRSGKHPDLVEREQMQRVADLQSTMVAVGESVAGKKKKKKTKSKSSKR